MKILLIGGISTDLDAQNMLSKNNDLLSDLKLKQPIELQLIYLDQIIFEVSNQGVELYVMNSQNKQKLAGDIMFIRGPKLRKLYMDLLTHLSHYCDKEGIACINDYSSRYVNTKFSQLIYFVKYQAPILKTYFALNNALLIDTAERELGYPYILKSDTGSHGDSNYLINGRAEAERAASQEPEVNFLAQEYCQNDRDYRVLIAGKNNLIFERQGTADSHLNNTSKGGSAQLAPDAIPPEYITKSHEIAADLGMHIAGVDIVPKLNSEDFFFLEINSQPQLLIGAFLGEKKQLLAEFLGSVV